MIAEALVGVDLTLKTFQRRHIDMVLEIVKGNPVMAAKLLGISRRTMERWLGRDQRRKKRTRRL